MIRTARPVRGAGRRRARAVAADRGAGRSRAGAVTGRASGGVTTLPQRGHVSRLATPDALTGTRSRASQDGQVMEAGMDYLRSCGDGRAGTRYGFVLYRARGGKSIASRPAYSCQPQTS
jgi:hypothetical protein